MKRVAVAGHRVGRLALAWLGAVTLSGGGCTAPIGYHSASVAPDPTQQLFAIELQQEVTRSDVASVDKSKFVSESARDTLGSAASVAFIPPDVCAELKSADAGTKSSVQVASTSCSVLMSALEQAATEAGYEVVSSQVLRSANIGGAAGYLENARDLEIDVIFEVGEWNFEDRAQQMKDVRGFQPLVQAPSGEFLPFEFRLTDAWKEAFGRCEALLATELESVVSEGSTPLAALLSLKAVDVSNGRTLWFYTKRSDVDRARAEGAERWIFAADPIEREDGNTCADYMEHVKDRYPGTWAVGGACRLRGVNPALDGRGDTVGDFDADPTPNEALAVKALDLQARAGLANALAIFILPLFIGIPLGAAGNGKMKKWNASVRSANRERDSHSANVAPVAVAAADYPAAEQVLCRPEHLVSDQGAPQAVQTEPALVSGYRVKQTREDPARNPVTQELIRATAEALQAELRGFR